MPVIFSEVYDHRHKHGECAILVRLENVKEIVVLEEAHCPISYLKMNPSDTLDNALEKFWNQIFHLVDFAHFEYLL